MATPGEKPQNFENHRAVTPWYLLAGVVIAAEAVVRIVQAVRDPGAATIWAVAVAAALFVVWGASREKAKLVQDRVIRLEMQLRLARVLPSERRGDIGRLSLGQLIALRFASDEELPALVAATLSENLTDRSEIKRRVKHWQADWLRV